jgi:integrase
MKMTRRSWLPDGVTEYKDRHGKPRYRFRKVGYHTHHFKAQPGSAEFMSEYAAAKEAKVEKAAISTRAVIPGSIDDLCIRYYGSPAWKKMADNSKATYRGIIERFRERRKQSGRRYGDLPAASMTTAHIDEILGGMSSTPAAANNLRKVLKRIFKIAVKAGLRSDNPVTETDTYKSGKGFHTWEEEEIEQYRAKHPAGTMARLALELALNTAARRCNVARLERDQLKDGLFYIEHVKGNDPTIVECLDETKEAIDAMPVAGLQFFLLTSFGKPFSVAGFGNKVREWCDAAGLPHCSLHGLRKAMSRRLAEAGSTDAEGRAITGHKKNQTFAYYAAKANRKNLAAAGVANLKNKGLANRPKGGDKS